MTEKQASLPDGIISSLETRVPTLNHPDSHDYIGRTYGIDPENTTRIAEEIAWLAHSEARRREYGRMVLGIANEKNSDYDYRKDQLTGLDSYATFQANIHNIFQNGRRSDALFVDGGQTLPSMVFFVDGDGIKGLNDVYGHDAVDRGIIGIGRVLRSCLRRSDQLCRRSGDEFIGVVLGASAEESREIIERIRVQLADGVAFETGQSGQTATLSATIMELYQPDVQNPEDIFAMVEQTDLLVNQRKKDRRAKRPRL